MRGKSARKEIAIILSIMFVINQLLFLLAYELIVRYIWGQEGPNPLQILWETGTFQYLIYAEALIFLIENLLVMAVLMWGFIFPLERLRKAMLDYRKGVRPKNTCRRDEIGQLQNSLVALTEQVDEEKQRQNQIIASISHDIKTPLTSVMGYSERLMRRAEKEDSAFSERDRRYLKTIHEKAMAIRELVEEFDDYLGIQLSRELKLQSVTAEYLAALIREDYGEELEARGIELVTNIRDAGLVVRADVSKLQRVFGNIIGNSLRYLPKEGGRIAIEIRREQGYVSFCVSDNGCGVPEGRLKQIFEPLYTSDESRSVAGLGLAICRELIQSHGGHIRARNNLSGGLSIEIYLPASEQGDK